MNDGGKGSVPRPKSITEEEYASRWDMIFGRDLKKEEKEEKEDKEPEKDKVSP